MVEGDQAAFGPGRVDGRLQAFCRRIPKVVPAIGAPDVEVPSIGGDFDSWYEDRPTIPLGNKTV